MLETPIHVEAQHLKFGDTVLKSYPFRETLHVIEAKPFDSTRTTVYLSPTDGLGLDEHFAVPNEFCFEVISRLAA